jgi:hypothetical protein
MVSELLFSQLGLIALVWLCFLLQWVWPSDVADVYPTTPTGTVAKFDFWGKIQKSDIRNSMTYRMPNSRKSNVATEPKSIATTRTQAFV